MHTLPQESFEAQQVPRQLKQVFVCDSSVLVRKSMITPQKLAELFPRKVLEVVRRYQRRLVYFLEHLLVLCQIVLGRKHYRVWATMPITEPAGAVASHVVHWIFLGDESVGWYEELLLVHLTHEDIVAGPDDRDEVIRVADCQILRPWHHALQLDLYFVGLGHGPSEQPSAGPDEHESVKEMHLLDGSCKTGVDILEVDLVVYEIGHEEFPLVCDCQKLIARGCKDGPSL